MTQQNPFKTVTLAPKKKEEQRVPWDKRPAEWSLPWVMSQFDKMRPTPAQRDVLSKWLYTRQYKGNPTLGRITGMETDKPWDILSNYRITESDYRQAKAALTSGDLSGLVKGHAQFVQQRDELRKRKAAQEQALAEQKKQQQIAESIASLPFEWKDFEYSLGRSDVVRLKPGTVALNKYPDGAMPIADAQKLLHLRGIPVPTQVKGVPDAYGLRGLGKGEVNPEAYKPPTEASLNMAGVEAVADETLGDAIGIFTNPNATPEQSLNGLVQIITSIPAFEPLKALAFAAKGGKAIKAALSTEEAWRSFAYSLEKMGVPNDSVPEIVARMRTAVRDSSPDYWETVGLQGKGGLDDAAEFASRQVGTPPDAPPVGAKEAIDRFKAAMSDSEKVGRPAREKAVDLLRETQAGKLHGVSERGAKAVAAGRAARKVGEAENPDFIFKEPIPKADQDALFNVILDHPWDKRVHARQDALEALEGIFKNGKLPAQYEMDLLEEVFGADFARAITGQGKTVAGQINKWAREMQLMNPWSRAFDVVSNATKFGAYVALNPARSVLSYMLFGKTVGRETIITPAKIWNVAKGYRKTLSDDVNEVISGINKATGAKFEGRTGVFTKAAAMTDAPFYPLYERLAMDDYAVTAAKNLPGGVKANRQAIFKQLTEGATGPLSKRQVAEAKAIANDWALRQTYNIDNFASRAVGKLKNEPAKFIEKQFPGQPGRELADFWRLGVDMNTRFSRVIGNVALDAANYIPAVGLTEAGVRTLFGKWSKGITSKDARLIADLASKGLAGTALTTAGAAMYPMIKDQQWIKGEVVTTSGGTKFVQWKMLPEAFDGYGAMDADQLPGFFKAILRGATSAMLDEKVASGEITAKQRDDIWLKYQLDQAVSQPLVSGSLNALKTMTGDQEFGKYAGSRIASAVIPGGSRELAERMDESRTGISLRKANEGQSKFWAEFIKRIPVYRESLATNIKGAGGQGTAPTQATQMSAAEILRQNKKKGK